MKTEIIKSYDDCCYLKHEGEILYFGINIHTMLSFGGQIEGNTGRISSVHVPEEHRLKGVGRAFVNFAVDTCILNGAVRILADVSPRALNHGFWKAMGFEHISTSPIGMMLWELKLTK